MTKTKKPGRPKGTGPKAAYTRSVPLKLRPETYTAACLAAEADGRAVTAWMRRQIEKAVEGEKG